MINYDISRIKRNLNKWTSTTKRIVLVQFFFSPLETIANHKPRRICKCFLPTIKRILLKNKFILILLLFLPPIYKTKWLDCVVVVVAFVCFLFLSFGATYCGLGVAWQYGCKRRRESWRSLSSGGRGGCCCQLLLQTDTQGQERADDDDDTHTRQQKEDDDEEQKNKRRKNFDSTRVATTTTTNI